MDINEIKQQIDIKDLLNRLGANFNGKNRTACIFHKDSNPSLDIYPDEGRFYCHGCKQGGDIFDAVGLIHNCPGSSNLAEQKRIIAQMYGIELTPLTQEQKKRQLSLRLAEEILHESALFYHQQLLKNQEMLQYVLNRGISQETISKLKIGYTTGTIIGHLLKKYKPEEVLLTGLFIKSKNGIMPFFVNRIFFPYWKSGKIVYGIGRKTNLTPDNEWEQGKYKKLLTHSEKRPYVLMENRYLYNEDCIKSSINSVIITEGIIDSILLDQLGFPVISPITTQFSNMDIEKLLNQCKKVKHIYIINDNEENQQGLKGGLKTAKLLLNQGQTAKLVIIPKELSQDKIDIADYIQLGKTKEDILELCKNSQSYIDYEIEQIPVNSDPEELYNHISGIIELIKNLPGMVQDDYINKISKKFKVSKTRLSEMRKTEAKEEKTLTITTSLKNGYKIDFDNNRIEKEFTIGDYTHLKPISNFSATVEKIIEKDDGINKSKAFVGTITTEIKKKYNYSIPDKDWASNSKFLEALINICGTDAVIFPKEERHVANAIQLFSQPVEDKIYTHTGWRDNTYVFPGASINKDGIIEDTIKVQLPDGCESVGFKKLSKERVKEVIEKGIIDGLFKIYDYSITLPALSHVFVPIISDKLSIGKKYVLWISGTTGKYKTAFSCMLQSFYGNFTDEVPLQTWRSTPNSIEKLGFHLKDMLYLVDDYKKGTVGWGQELFIQSYADQISRGRLNKNAELQKKYPIRGFMLSTGEDLPTGEASLISRLLPLEISTKGDIQKLSQAQKYADDFRGIMPEFIYYFLNSETPEQLMEKFKKRREEVLKKLIENKKYGEINIGRIAFNIALNMLAFDKFLNFCTYLQINTKTLQELKNIYSNEILRFMPLHQQKIKEESASVIFLSTLRELILTNKVQILNEYNEPNKSEIIGFTSTDFVYLYPQIAYMVVQKCLRDSGENLKFSKNAIWKQLLEEGYLAKYGKDKTTFSYRKGENVMRVLCLRKSLLLEEDEQK